MRTLSIVVALLLVGCNGGNDTEADEALASRTWYADVKPVVDRHCVRCHDGVGLGPGDFTDPDLAKAYAPLMVAKIAAGQMPPPAADPTCHDYADSDTFYADPAIADIVQGWIDNDYALGEPGATPTGKPAIQQLSRRDLEVRTAAPYTPEFVENNEYRCFVLDIDTSSELYVSGFEPIIDNGAISHHTVFFVDPTGNAGEYVTDEATQSWRCPEVVPDPNWLMLHAWAPGNNPIEFQDGLAMPVEAGSKLILQMHYYDSGESVQDDPGYWLKLEPDGGRQTMYFLPLGPEGFTIPAGVASHVEEESYVLDWGLPLTTTIYGVFPHMHVLGSAYEFTATHPDGTEACISRAAAYDFSNQPTYWFDDPIELPENSSVSISCTYDNSSGNADQINDPPVDVTWGENTDQEMCYALMYATIAP